MNFDWGTPFGPGLLNSMEEVNSYEVLISTFHFSLFGSIQWIVFILQCFATGTCRRPPVLGDFNYSLHWGMDIWAQVLVNISVLIWKEVSNRMQPKVDPVFFNAFTNLSVCVCVWLSLLCLCLVSKKKEKEVRDILTNWANHEREKSTSCLDLMLEAKSVAVDWESAAGCLSMSTQPASTIKKRLGWNVFIHLHAGDVKLQGIANIKGTPDQDSEGLICYRLGPWTRWNSKVIPIKPCKSKIQV